MENTGASPASLGGGDFVRFWRIPEGNCELLSARYTNQSFGRHSHDRYALGVISGGSEKLFYRGGYTLGGTGSVVTISPGEIHDGLPGQDSGWMYRMLYLDPDWVNRVVLQGRVASDHVHLYHQALSSNPGFARTFLQQHQLIEELPHCLQRESVLLDLVCQVFERSGAPTVPVRPAELLAVRRIKHKLEDEFSREVSLEALAQLVNMEPLYLIRVFKKHVGVAPHSYQIQKRIAHVQMLLRAGSSLTEAACASGFFDQSHMARAFKKVVGMTPGCFRNSGGVRGAT